MPDDNPLTRDKIALGKQLFWDKRLALESRAGGGVLSSGARRRAPAGRERVGVARSDQPGSAPCARPPAERGATDTGGGLQQVRRGL